MNTRHHHVLFDVVCYNILAQTLVESNPYLYVDCQPEHLDWDRRKKLLLKELIRQNADVGFFSEATKTK
jgi:mRNA deadenylase 3'-5' endonuclease subunit Ccr4